MDKFKALNDTLGHDYGDMLLVEIAKRLKFCVREIDTVARLGGDEFVVLIENISADAEEATINVAQIAEKIRAVLATPYQLKEAIYHSSPSIGVCLYYDNMDSVDELIKRADMAMYQAKDSGRNKVNFFDPHMQHSLEVHAALEADLREAISDQQFRLFYQIQIDHNHHPVGAEALIRWIHPQRGMVLPAEFIPFAEENSLILDIGNWVIDSACKQIADWSHNEQTRNLVLAINISAQQFKQLDFVTQLEVMLHKHHIEPSRLKLELTESVALNDIDSVVIKMRALKQIGIALSLDDFGTGYSSLSYLKRLPLDQIKIDKSFVRDITTDSSDAVMVKTIIDMAHNFDLNVIAEGVETEEQFSFLKENDCLSFQGYLFSRPVPLEEFEALLSN
jgi:diguanylate cyclase (GGDEF)-like protein